MDPRTKRRFIASVVTVVALGVLVAGVVVTKNYLSTTVYGPQNKVEAYLEAIVSGKASEALALYSPNVTDDRRELLSNEIYAAAEYRPTDYRIEDIDITEKGANVSAQLRQNGQEYPIVFTLKTDGKQAVIFDDWRITSGPLQSVVMSRVPEELSVNGVIANVSSYGNVEEFGAISHDWSEYLEAEVASYTLPVLPGTYTFAAPAGSKYVTYGQDVAVTVTPAQLEHEVPWIAFEKQYTAEVISDAVAQVTKALETCTSPKELRVTGCEIVSWEDTSWDAMRNIEREWATPVSLAVVDRERLSQVYEQPDLSELTTQDLAVAVLDGEIRMTYDVRNEGMDEWYEGRTRHVRPFVVNAGFWSSERLEFPITIDGDSLSVDTSAIHQVHQDWLRSH